MFLTEVLKASEDGAVRSAAESEDAFTTEVKNNIFSIRFIYNLFHSVVPKVTFRTKHNNKLWIHFSILGSKNFWSKDRKVLFSILGSKKWEIKVRGKVVFSVLNSVRKCDVFGTTEWKCVLRWLMLWSYVNTYSLALENWSLFDTATTSEKFDFSVLSKLGFCCQKVTVSENEM